MNKFAGSIIYFSAALILSAVAHADGPSCSEKRASAGSRFDSASDLARDEAERQTIASQLATRTRGLSSGLSAEDRDSIRKYLAHESGKPSVDELRALLNRRYASSTSCPSGDTAVNETGYANRPVSQNGFHICRHVEKSETSYVGHALGEFWDHLKKPFFCDNLSTLNCSFTTWYASPQTTYTYSYSYPSSESSIQVLEPSVDTAANDRAPNDRNRFKVRLCQASSRDGARATRLCEVLDLQGLLDRSVTTADVLGDNPDLSQIHPTRERYVSLQSRELCPTAYNDGVVSDLRVATGQPAQRPQRPIRSEGARPAASGDAAI